MSDVAVPGFVAGTLGGLLMALLALAYAGIFAGRPLEPFQLVAGLFLRGRGLEELGPGAAVLGFAIHMGVATGLATMFATLLPRGHTAVAALGWAWLFSMGVYVVMTELIIPFASPLLDRNLQSLPFFALHLVFGACLPLVASVRRLVHRVERLREKVDAWLEEPQHV